MTDQGRLTIEVTTGHCLGGVDNDVFPGQVLVAPKDLPVADAWKKVRMGYARVIPDTPEVGPESKEAPGPATIANQDPALETRDPSSETSKKRKSRSRAGRR